MKLELEIEVMSKSCKVMLRTILHLKVSKLASICTKYHFQSNILMHCTLNFL